MRNAPEDVLRSLAGASDRLLPLTDAGGHELVAVVSARDEPYERDALRDLLDLSTIEQGRYQVDLQRHRLEDLFEDSLALLGPIAESKRIALHGG